MSHLPPTMPELTTKQRDLQSKLATAIRESIPAEVDLDKAQRRAQGRYQLIAELLVELRHEFPGPDGEQYDLRGRSPAYRIAVREAYAQAGVDTEGAIPKRLTAGVAYWVRKILIERYGESRPGQEQVAPLPAQVHRPAGIVARPAKELPEDPALRLNAVIGILNMLATDPQVVPTEENVRSARRAALLLQDKLRSRLRALGSSLTAVSPAGIRRPAQLEARPRPH
jgi:hypothetical protein